MSFSKFCSCMVELLGWSSSAIIVIYMNVTYILLTICYHISLQMNSSLSSFFSLHVLKCTCFCTCGSFCFSDVYHLSAQLIHSRAPFLGNYFDISLQAELCAHSLQPFHSLIYFLHNSNESIWWFLDYSLIPLLEWKLLRIENIYFLTPYFLNVLQSIEVPQNVC